MRFTQSTETEEDYFSVFSSVPIIWVNALSGGTCASQANEGLWGQGALESFWDGLIPPGKSERYIATVAAYVDPGDAGCPSLHGCACAPEAGHSEGRGGAVNQKT